MSKLTICLLTYNRLDYAKKTLIAALRHVCWNGETTVHIASDGDSYDYIDELAKVVYDIGGKAVSTSNSERRGYGANMNLAIQHMLKERSDYILWLEDDWELQRDLIVDALAAVMDQSTYIDCIRLGYLSFTSELRGRLLKYDELVYLQLDPTSPELHVFAGHPRLETLRRQTRVGKWPEGLHPGWTEHKHAENPEARKGIAWPLDMIPPHGGMFVHIGTVKSYVDDA